MLKVLIFLAFCAEVYPLSTTGDWQKLMKNVNKDTGIDLSEEFNKINAGRKVADVVRELMKSHLDTDVPIRDNSSVCSCQKNTCGCCLHLEWDQVKINDTVCTNFTYIPAEYGISLTFSLDGKILYNDTISAKNPPPICAGIPYLKKFASLCIRFGNLDFSNKTLSGCVYVSAKLEGFKIKEVEIGCFKIPPGQTEDVTLDTMKMVKYGLHGNTDDGLHGNADDESNMIDTVLDDTDMTLRFKPMN